MKFTDIPSLEMSPGRLTVWRVGTPPAATWRADPRPASHVQEAHLAYALASAGDRPPPSWLGIAFDLPADLDADAFAVALREWTDRHENLRSRLISCPSSTPARLRRETLPTGVVTVRPMGMGEFTDGARLARTLEELFDHEAGPLGWPGFVCATVARPEATTVHLAADHSLMDGYSVFLIPHEIRTLYATAPGTAPALAPVRSYLDFATAERAAADALTADHASVVRWRTFLAECGGRLPEFPVPVNDVSGSPGAQPSGHTPLLDASAARHFERACRAAGGDTFAGVLACLSKAGQETTGEREFRTTAPFHTRAEGWWSSVGWYVGMAPVAFALPDTDAFEDAVRAARSGLEELREVARVPVPRVTELIGEPLRDPFMVSYMDLRLTPGSREWGAGRTVALRGRSDDPDEVCFWVTRTHEGLAVSHRHPATGPAGIAVPHYVARARQLMTAVVETGDWQAAAEEARLPR
ncbi:condensation domain-containing protein [Streptomyces sp. NPDC002643]